jgi:hypothetical protein
MAGQRSRGGKKAGTANPWGSGEQHQPTHPPQGREQGSGRPDKGEPGGPKPSAGKTRPQH